MVAQIKSSRALGAALLAALGIMAMGTGAARAEIVVEGQPPAHRTLDGIILGTRVLRNPAGIQISCTNGGTVEHLILTDNIIHTTRLYNGCVTVGMPNCLPYETLNDSNNRVNAGHWIEKSLGIFAESEGKHYLVSETSKEPIATLYFDEECALPSELKLTGTTAFKAPDILEKLVTHTFEPVSEKEEKTLKVGLTLGKEKAFLEGGKEEVKLTGKEAGLTWWLK
jgi:hypothetical protein